MIKCEVTSLQYQKIMQVPIDSVIKVKNTDIINILSNIEFFPIRICVTLFGVILQKRMKT